MIDFNRIEGNEKIELTLKEYLFVKKLIQSQDKLFIVQWGSCRGYDLVTKDDAMRELLDSYNKAVRDLKKLEEISYMSVEEFKQYKKGK